VIFGNIKAQPSTSPSFTQAAPICREEPSLRLRTLASSASRGSVPAATASSSVRAEAGRLHSVWMAAGRRAGGSVP
jgi:hypothetical protein